MENQSQPTESAVESQSHPTGSVVKSVSSKKKNKFYAELEDFTISNDEELATINHIRIFTQLKSQKKYKCIKCGSMSQYFSEAERHKMEHDYNEFSHVRDALKTIEIDRASYSKELRHSKKNHVCEINTIIALVN